MSKMIRLAVVLAATVFLAGAVGLAQPPGQTTYRARCQGCHGTSGVPFPGIAKIMGVKAANDPAMKKDSEALMIAAVENGKGKMPAFKGKLTDAQVKAAVEYFRTFMKK
jgi:cytochrome c5